MAGYVDLQGSGYQLGATGHQSCSIPLVKPPAGPRKLPDVHIDVHINEVNDESLSTKSLQDSDSYRTSSAGVLR